VHRATLLDWAVGLLVAAGALIVGLPALADSGAHALQVACVNNLKNIGAGFLTYANDYGRMLPDWGCQATCCSEPCWHAHLYDGAYVPAAAFVCPAESAAVDALAQGGTWGVPENRVDAGLETPNVSTYQTYLGMTSWYQGEDYWDGSIRQAHSPVGRLSDNRLGILWDAMMCFTFDAALAQAAWQWVSPSTPDPYRASARHEGTFGYEPGTFNVLWLDGHVTNVTEDRISHVERIVRHYSSYPGLPGGTRP